MNSKNNKADLLANKVVKTEDDFSLITDFISGNEDAFEMLIRKHKEKVRNIVYLTLGNSSQVDDIAQEVFITLYKSLKHFRFQSKFTTWLYRITVNKSKDYIRKMKIRSIFQPIENIDTAYGSLKEEKDVFKSEILQSSISKLPEKLRTPLLLKDIEGFSYEEISQTLNCELGTVKSRIFRARENLRNILEPYKEELML